MTEEQKNAMAQELCELLKGNVIGALPGLLMSEDPDEFTDNSIVAIESTFLLLSNLGSLMIMRLTHAGMPMEDAKKQVQGIFGSYLDDTVTMAGERVKKVEEMLQEIIGTKHRGH